MRSLKNYLENINKKALRYQRGRLLFGAAIGIREDDYLEKA